MSKVHETFKPRKLELEQLYWKKSISGKDVDMLIVLQDCYHTLKRLIPRNVFVDESLPQFENFDAPDCSNHCRKSEKIFRELYAFFVLCCEGPSRRALSQASLKYEVLTARNWMLRYGISVSNSTRTCIIGSGPESQCSLSLTSNSIFRYSWWQVCYIESCHNMMISCYGWAYLHCDPVSWADLEVHYGKKRQQIHGVSREIRANVAST